MRASDNPKTIVIDDIIFHHLKLDFNAFNISPQYKDERNSKYVFHKYGEQLFCKFKLSERGYDIPGLYIFVFDNTIRYLGECENLHNRINNGYGNISPRNCYVGGQPTNCKINGIINRYSKNTSKVKLYFSETSISSYQRKRIESALIRKLNLVSEGLNGKT